MQVETVEDLLQEATRKYFAVARGRWVFRGHSDKRYSLIPSVGRAPYTSRTREKYEESLFNIFRREAQSYLNILPQTDREWLAFAQHHFLPTRLLDWSYNPLTALYFTVTSSPPHGAVSAHDLVDGELIALYSPTQASVRVRAGSPFEIRNPVKYFPTIVSPRISAQEGLFVAFSKIETSLEEQLPDKWIIEKLLVPACAKEKLRYGLFRLGVHASSMFPDVDGLAARLRWQHGVNSPFKNEQF
jgi:type I restriction enzyme M protein